MTASASFGQEPAAQGNAVARLPPLIMTKLPSPKYPKDAHGISGWVRVECLVKPSGRLKSCRVVESEPADIFDKAALIAIKKARFEPFDSREPRLMVQRLIFSPG